MFESIDSVTPGRIADTGTYDGAAHNVIETCDGDLLLVYTQNDGAHFSTDGRVVMRRSADSGRSWSDPRELHNEDARDATSPSVVYHPETDRIDVFDVSFSVRNAGKSKPNRDGFVPHRVTSTDLGRSWDAPVSVAEELRNPAAAPFGGEIRTAHGSATAFYSREYELELLFSRDGGESWATEGTIAESPPGRELAEPVPVAVTPEKLVLFGRDNATGDFFALTSSDGGLSWTDPVFFNPTGSETPCPIWAKKTAPNELTAVWGDRDDRYIYAVMMSAHLAWQDPTTLSDGPRTRLHRQIGPPGSASYWSGDAGDFGYPTFVRTRKGGSGVLVTFYDEGPNPNLWQMPLPRRGQRSWSHGDFPG
jgi:hypothetical protein